MINLDGIKKGIVVYKRFHSAYIMDFYDFQEGDTEFRVDLAFGVFFSRDYQTMMILGIDTAENESLFITNVSICLLYTSPSPRD